MGNVDGTGNDGALKVTYMTSKWIPRVDEYLWLSDGASFGFPDGDPCFTSQPIGFLTEAYVDYIRVWKPQVSTVQNVPETNILEMKTRDNKLQIASQSTISSVRIYDSLGRLINKQLPETNSANFELPDSGLYIVNAELQNGTSFLKKVLIPE